MRSRARRAGMAAASIALLTVALVGCQPSASGSPDESIPDESITLDSFPASPSESPEPSETPES